MGVSERCRAERIVLLKGIRKYRNLYFGVNLNQRTYDLVCRCVDFRPDPTNWHPPYDLDACFVAPAWPGLVKWCLEQGFSCSRGEHGIRIRERLA